MTKWAKILVDCSTKRKTNDRKKYCRRHCSHRVTSIECYKLLLQWKNNRWWRALSNGSSVVANRQLPDLNINRKLTNGKEWKSQQFFHFFVMLQKNAFYLLGVELFWTAINNDERGRNCQANQFLLFFAHSSPHSMTSILCNFAHDEPSTTSDKHNLVRWWQLCVIR